MKKLIISTITFFSFVLFFFLFCLSLVAIFSSPVLQEEKVKTISEDTIPISDTEYLLQLINNSRTEPVVLNKKLNEAAKNKADDMFKYNYFTHNSPTGIEPWDWIRKANYNYKYAGENIAMNFLDIEETHLALMNSPLHKEVIINPKYDEVGIAIIEGEFKGRRTVIIVVEMFGSLNNKTNTFLDLTKLYR